jgi:YhcN/YlaJ family sporulation lipoprotein
LFSNTNGEIIPLGGESMNKRFPWIKGMLITGLLFTAVGCTNQAGVHRQKSASPNYHPARVSYNTGNGMNRLPGTTPLNTGIGNTTGVGNTTGIGSTTGVGNTTGIGSATGVGNTTGAGSTTSVGNTTGVGSTTGTGSTTGVGNTTAQCPSTQQVQLADNIADSLAELKAVQSACALVKNQNAYVCVVPEPGMKQLTDGAKKNITNCVKRVNPSVQNVYVSSDPQFCKQMYDCTIDLRTGQSVDKSTQNIAGVLNRMFPQAR